MQEKETKKKALENINEDIKKRIKELEQEAKKGLRKSKKRL